MNVLFELPLARAVMHRHGRTCGIDILRRYASDDVDEKTAGLAWDAVRSKIERNPDPDTGAMHIQCVFALTDEAGDGDATLDRAIYWDNQGIVACGRQAPEISIGMMAGRAMTSIIDHPYLEGLTVLEAHNHVDGDTCALVVDAVDCLWDLRRVEAEA